MKGDTESGPTTPTAPTSQSILADTPQSKDANNSTDFKSNTSQLPLQAPRTQQSMCISDFRQRRLEEPTFDSIGMSVPDEKEVCGNRFESNQITEQQSPDLREVAKQKTKQEIIAKSRQEQRRNRGKYESSRPKTVTILNH